MTKNADIESAQTYSAEETIAWGRKFAAQLKAPVLVLLSGEMGSGKTTLTKGIVAGLQAAQEDEVTSPTFTLLHEYEGAASKVFHGDLYRIESLEDFESLGMEDLFAHPAIVILEWPEKFPLQTAWPVVKLRLQHLGGDARQITLL